MIKPADAILLNILNAYSIEFLSSNELAQENYFCAGRRKICIDRRTDHLLTPFFRRIPAETRKIVIYSISMFFIKESIAI